MPRIYDSTSIPHDFCRKCFEKHYPTEAIAFKKLGGLGDGPDDRGNCFGYDDDHPSYDNEYNCDKCNKPLTDEVDGFLNYE